MKKLKLELNDLKVESFETTKVHGSIGTIQGQAMVKDSEAFPEQCEGGGTATYETYCGTCPADSCALTCGASWCQSCVYACPSDNCVTWVVDPYCGNH